jgi:four helix bundle protein
METTPSRNPTYRKSLPSTSQPSTLSEPMFNFEKLEVWHQAIEFAHLVYSNTRTFPSGERVGLMNQMRRTAISISINIAEGSSRNSRKDFARFIEIATGSLFEVVSQSFIARNQGHLTEARFQSQYTAAQQQGKMLSGLRRSLLEEA